MHFSPLVALVAVRSKAVVLLFMVRCWLLLPLWNSVIVLCFVVRYFLSILVLQSSQLVALLYGVSWLLCGSSSRCHGFVCSLWLWYFLIILTYYLWSSYPSLIITPPDLHPPPSIFCSRKCQWVVQGWSSSPSPSHTQFPPHFFPSIFVQIWKFLLFSLECIQTKTW